MSDYIDYRPENRTSPKGCDFSVWRKGAWQPFSYNPSVEDAVKMLRTQDVKVENFIIKEYGSTRQWDGFGKPIDA